MKPETIDKIANAVLKLNLQKPIAFFDLETTGVDVAKDRIVSIAILKINPDGTIEDKERMINPGIPIPKGASDVHGITDEMVHDLPEFKLIAIGLRDFLKGCDLAGFNSNHFDIPLLAEEFERCQIEFPEPGTKFIDVFNIYRKFDPRDLKAAARKYIGNDNFDAHNAMADIDATLQVFAAQLSYHPELEGKGIQEIIDAVEEKKNKVDLAGHILIDDEGDFVYGSGKHKGTKIKKDLGFADWMLKQSHYTMNTKRHVARVVIEIRNKIQQPNQFDMLV
jgi:DNA polymerase III subunit epsilon